MTDINKTLNRMVSLMLFLSIASLFLENGLYQAKWIRLFTNILDYIVFLLFITEIAIRYVHSKYKFIFLKQNVFELLFLVVFSTLFVYSKYVGYLIESRRIQNLSRNIIILRNVFILVKIFVRLKKFNALMNRLSKNPAQTIVLSFITVIIIGTLFLMMPFSTHDYSRLGFINSLFTSTSAVCVTGLIVVDTATRFSMIGKIIIIFLIQIGGLGIMILSYFGSFIFRRRFSVEGRLLVSYMLNEGDMSSLARSMKNIVLATVILEFAGFIALYFAFKPVLGKELEAVSNAAFHSVSAFCNAGFSTFSENLVGYTSNVLVNITVALLIILGGLSFTVLMELYQFLKNRARRMVFSKQQRLYRFSLNTRIVLITSGILILLGTLIIYPFEYKTTFIGYDLKTQYLAAFFQSVSLRTAGFNTVDFTMLNRFTYLIMILFMFIGGASGSTAGGVKVNTVAILGGYVRSIIDNREDVTVFNQTLSKDLVNKALFIVFIYSIIIFFSTIILSMTEEFDIVPILFEIVSAMGTVGLSAGITQHLSIAGKVLIIILMFAGRVGPLTIVVSLSQRQRVSGISYPSGNITIG